MRKNKKIIHCENNKNMAYYRAQYIICECYSHEVRNVTDKNSNSE